MMSYKVYDSAAMSGTDTVYSKMWSVRGDGGFSMQARWTGTPTGTFTLWRSNVPRPNEASDTDWDAVPSSEVDFTGKQPAGSASGWTIDVSAGATAHYRFKYVNATGTGALVMYVHVPQR